jgi:hypothetical protein
MNLARIGGLPFRRSAFGLIALLATLATTLYAQPASSRDGRWSGTYNAAAKELHLSINFGKGGESRTDWNLPLAALRSLSFVPGQSAEPATFEVPREAGTFHFTGSMKGAAGSGFYTFTPDPSFIPALRSLGLDAKSEDQQEYAIFDVTENFARDMQKAGYGRSMKALVDFRIFKIDSDFIAQVQQLKGSKPTEEDLTDCRIFNVNVPFRESIERLGFKSVPLDDLVSMRLRNVTPEYITQVRSLGYPDVKVDQLIDLRLFGVSVDFIKTAQAYGYKDLTIEQLIDLKRSRAAIKLEKPMI